MNLAAAAAAAAAAASNQQKQRRSWSELMRGIAAKLWLRSTARHKANSVSWAASERQRSDALRKLEFVTRSTVVRATSLQRTRKC